MTCDACIDFYDGDEPVVFTEHDRQARKKHRCCECRRDILPGEIYREERGLWDGEWEMFRTCNDCLSVRAAMTCRYQYGELWAEVADFVSDVCGDVPEDCLATITPRARERLCALIEEVWVLEPGGDSNSHEQA